MLMMQKPKIGFLGLMQGLYDKSQPELPKMQEKFALQVVEQLKDVADVDFPGPAKEREDIERYVKMFNDKEYDGIMIVNLLYSPGNRLIQAMKKNRLPVLVANSQPRPDVTKEWDWILCTTNQGIHGCQDTCNVLMRCGVKPAIITEDWKSDNFKKLFSDWAYAANTCIRLKKTKLAIFGRMHNMGDILGDDAALCRKFGVEANHETIGPVYYAMETTRRYCSPTTETREHRVAAPGSTLNLGVGGFSRSPISRGRSIRVTPRSFLATFQLPSPIWLSMAASLPKSREYISVK